MVKKKENHKKEILSVPDFKRRFFLNKLWIGLGILGLAEFVYLVIAYLRPGRGRIKSGDSGLLIDAGHVDSFPLNSVTAFVRGKFYLCRLDDGGFLALSSKCTHLGCTLPWDDKGKRFACPCHGSIFDITGEVITRPAPRPMDTYRIVIENGIVKVDRSIPVKRDGFIKDQLVYHEKA